MKKVLEKLTSKKLYLYYFVSSILIVYIHCNPLQWEIKMYNSNIFTYIGNFFQCFTCAAVPFFFLASGFLLYKDLSFDNIKKVIKKKVKRYGIPYFTWSFICFLIIDYLRNMDYRYIPIFLLTSSFDGPLWFIEVLILLTLLSPVFLFILRNKKISILFLIFLFLASYYINIPITGSSIEISLICSFQSYLKLALPYYFLGAFFGKFYFDTINKEKYISKLLIIVSFICILILYGQYFSNFPIKITGIVYTILLRFQCVFIWIVFPKKIFNYKDHWWYHQTFFTYAAHWIFIWLTSKLINHFSYNNIFISASSFFFFRLAITVVISLITILLGKITMMLCPKFYSILTGEKIKKTN